MMAFPNDRQISLNIGSGGCALLVWSALGLLICGVPASSTAAPQVAECANYSSERQAFFGDLHIHTGVSADAMLFGTRNRPDDAYAFARGKEIFVTQNLYAPDFPLAAKLERPLDFAAVTDHAENIGTVSLCMTPGTDVYDSEHCRYVRRRLPTDDMATFSSELEKVWQTRRTVALNSRSRVPVESSAGGKPGR